MNSPVSSILWYLPNQKGKENNFMHCIKYLCGDNHIKIKIKSVAYSSQGSHTGQLDFCNWLADGKRRDNVISITLRQV